MSGLTPLGWLGIARLGLVQTALGSIVVLTTSTLNRVMVVELALPAVLPGFLVAVYYAVQLTRPRFGHGSDVGGRHTPWIVGGMAVLALGGIAAAAATALMAVNAAAGIVLALLAFVMIGAAVGAAGTSLLVLLAKRVEPEKRGPAASLVWIMMIAGFAVTATLAGQFLDPFSLSRLIAVSATVSAVAFVITVLAVYGIEGERRATVAAASAPSAHPSFRVAFRQVWAEPEARRFTIFVFISMMAYSAQDLILEPFAGAVFGMTPGESTKLSGMQNGGVLIGMLTVAVAANRFKGRAGSLRGWAIGGCIASALALVLLVFGGLAGPQYPLRANVFVLGIANGAFAVAAIGSMMAMVGRGRQAREGVRMGLWGAAQAIAFGLGSLAGTVGIDLARLVISPVESAYGIVFASAAALFLVAAVLAARLERPGLRPTAGETYATGASKS